jgi:hypothetical protein
VLPEQFGQLRDIRRDPPRLIACEQQFSKPGFGQGTAKLFNEVASRPQIGKAPPRIRLVPPNNLTAMPRLNVSALMKFDNPTVEFELQSVGSKSKFDDVRVFSLVRQHFRFRKLAHIPAPIV